MAMQMRHRKSGGCGYCSTLSLSSPVSPLYPIERGDNARPESAMDMPEAPNPEAPK